MKAATRDRPRGLARAGTGFQPGPLTQKALNANLKEPFESGH